MIQNEFNMETPNKLSLIKIQVFERTRVIGKTNSALSHCSVYLLLPETRFLSNNCLCDWKGKERGVGSAHLLPIPFFFPNSRNSLLYMLAYSSLWSAFFTQALIRP